MSGVLAVYEKEMRQYFRSPIAYFVVAVFLVGTGYFFNYNIFLTGVAAMDETFQNMGILVVVLSPLVAMRLFSAELGTGTMELLSTLPLSPWQLVLGKYLGALTLLVLDNGSGIPEDPVILDAPKMAQGSLRYLKTEGVSYVVSQESDDVTIIWLMDGAVDTGA